MEDSGYGYVGAKQLILNGQTFLNYNRWIVRMFAACIRQNKNRFNMRVLDFGAGIGSLALLFRDQTGIVPEAVEIDAVQRRTCISHGFNTSSSIDTVEPGVNFVYTSNVLEHIQDDVQIIRQIREKMAADGQIAIYVPAFEILWSTHDDEVGHQRRYTKQMLRSHLEQAGFQVEHIAYRDSVGFMLALLFRLVGSKSGSPGRVSRWLFDRILLPCSRVLDLIASPFFGKNIFAIARINHE